MQGARIPTTMDKRKANGLQDDIPNTPVKRYLERQKIKNKLRNNDAAAWGDTNGQQMITPQQQQQMQMQMQLQPQQQYMQPQQQQQLQEQQQQQLQQQQLQQQQMQQYQLQQQQLQQQQLQQQQLQQQQLQQQQLQQQQLQKQQLLQQQMLQAQQQQNMPQQENLQQQQQIPQQQQMIQYQDSEKCLRKRGTVENGMDAVTNQQKKQFSAIDAESSIWKQRGHENQWQFEKKNSSYEAGESVANQHYQQNPNYTEELQHSHNPNNPSMNQAYYPIQVTQNHGPVAQKMLFNPYASKFLNPKSYPHAPYMNPNPNPNPIRKPPLSAPLKNGMQPTRSQKLNKAYEQNYHGHNHQYQMPPGEQEVERPETSKGPDYENDPYIIGQNPRHTYQPMYAERDQQRNQFQQPTYYMNQPTGGQHYQQSFQGQAQMQA